MRLLRALIADVGLWGLAIVFAWAIWYTVREDLLESQALVVVPGAVFGADRHVRLSYATSMEKIRTALGRLSAFLRERRT